MRNLPPAIRWTRLMGPKVTYTWRTVINFTQRTYNRPAGRRAASGGVGMPRKARLFTSSSGSAARGFLKFRANIPPRWIKNAQTSRKRIEPEIVEALRSLISMRKNRPRAQVALKKAQHEFKAALSRWETAYNKENFYRGIRILLELQRNGSSKL